MNKIEHLGIAVENLETSSRLFELLLGNAPYKQEDVESEGVSTLFFNIGESKVELLKATNEQSPISKFLAKKGPGFHHVAFAVSDIRSEMNRLRDAGFELLNDEPKPGADNKLICFLHPRSTGGLLVELCQDAPL
ncbi:MAG: methylmalonyl-CoA epimerase [Bacteroidetes bacterium]|nr:methylmalonyl-CoA epimerase [Bacteroidota bacterium]